MFLLFISVDAVGSYKRAGYKKEFVGRIPSDSKGQFLHEEVDVLIDFESMQVSTLSLQTHQESTEGHICCPFGVNREEYQVSIDENTNQETGSGNMK